MSQALTLARPYARAAFMLARDAGALAEWSQALGFAARIAADPDASLVLGHPVLTREQAVALLAPEQAPAAFGDFLSLLADNRRLALLPEITGLYAELRAEAERVVKARVTSATTLPEAELESIRAALRTRFGREVELEASVDESLIGGAVIAADDVVIDGSLRGKLARLQAALAQ